jgi:hypothetical protein
MLATVFAKEMAKEVKRERYALKGVTRSEET